MSRFDAIRSQRLERTGPAAAPSGRAAGRTGKKAVSAYFSPDVSLALHRLALDQGTNLQALMGEAFDDLMRKYGRHPFGEG
jgi:hypothetical protein